MEVLRASLASCQNIIVQLEKDSAGLNATAGAKLSPEESLLYVASFLTDLA